MARPKTNFNFKIPTSWDEVTLDTFINLQALYKDDYKPSFTEIISVLSNIKKEELNNYPALIIEKVMDNLTFLSTPITNETNNTITINGERYIVNTEEELLFGEYVDAQTILDADRSNFKAILGILCRKEDEVYNDVFIAKKLNKRIEMFGQQPITKVYPIISFFLNKWILSPQNMKSYSEKLLDHTNQLVMSIEDSLKNGTGKKSFLNSPMRKLKKLKKSLKYI